MKSGPFLRGFALILMLVAPPVFAAAPEPAAADELDRPGEVENPFALPPGSAQFVSYALAANAPARENEELGPGGSATVLQTGIRFGLAPRWEGQVFADTLLNAIDKGPDGDDPGRSRAGVGTVTLRAKWTFFADDAGEAGLALVPFVRFPVRSTLAGRTGAEPGLMLPFGFDLEHGWEIQGSAGVTRGHGDAHRRTTEVETQASLEWHFAPRWTAYLEPELDGGEGRPRWALEEGITCFVSRRLQLDFGFNTGLGANSRARFGYLGLGWSL
jgi:hypothetical protein